MPLLTAVRERLRSSLWFIPALFALGAMVLAVVLIAVDRLLESDGSSPLRFGGTADGARSILSTIAQSMLSFTGLVFTVTMLVLQLASSQLSPRVMRTFLRDRGNQVVLGLFVATFLYTLMVLREVRTTVDDDPGFVPGLAIWAGFLLLLASVAAFVWYINHMAHAIRAPTVMDSIAAETRAAIDRLFPDPVGEDAPEDVDRTYARLGPPTEVLGAPRDGALVAVDESTLQELAVGDRRLELVPVVGSFVAEGAPLLRLWGTWDDDDRERLRGAMALGPERTMQQDPAFGFRQLVDIALRALSPGINDPTTASQSLDRIHGLLRRLVTRGFPSPARVDEEGVVRLVLRRPDWDAYTRLSTEEIRLAGADQIAVLRRLIEMLDDVAEVARGDRLGPLWAERSRVAADLEALEAKASS